MINVVPSTPYFALASQIYSTAPNMLEINWAPIVGAFVITEEIVGRHVARDAESATSRPPPLRDFRHSNASQKKSKS
jgi:hypothetical protein